MAGRKSASYEFYHLNKVIIIRLSLFRICLSAVVHIEELWPHENVINQNNFEERI